MITVDGIEGQFDSIFASMGFERVSKRVGPSPSFRNADYLRESDRMIVELKILDKDYFQQGGIIDRLCAIIPSPVNVNPDGTGIFDFTLPDRNRDGTYDTFEEPLRRIIKKANRQLKETNAMLLDDKGFGFVVFYMHGFTSLHPATVAEMISTLLTEEFRSIFGYILCARKPDLICISAMSPKLPSHEYNEWYNISDKVGEMLENSPFDSVTPFDTLSPETF